MKMHTVNFDGNSSDQIMPPILGLIRLLDVNFTTIITFVISFSGILFVNFEYLVVFQENFIENMKSIIGIFTHILYKHFSFTGLNESLCILFDSKCFFLCTGVFNVYGFM